jgi:hypothetical protein
MQGASLHYVLTSAQSTSLDAVVQAATELDQQQEDYQDSGPSRKKLDEACLLFCIALLDHPLHGKVYDSLIVG